MGYIVSIIPSIAGTSKFVTQPSQDYLYQLGPFPAAQEARIDFSIQSACPAEVVFKAKTTSVSDNYTLGIKAFDLFYKLKFYSILVYTVPLLTLSK